MGFGFELAAAVGVGEEAAEPFPSVIGAKPLTETIFDATGTRTWVMRSPDPLLTTTWITDATTVFDGDLTASTASSALLGTRFRGCSSLILL